MTRGQAQKFGEERRGHTPPASNQKKAKWKRSKSKANPKKAREKKRLAYIYPLAL
jgi:hypothetical protein